MEQRPCLSVTFIVTLVCLSIHVAVAQPPTPPCWFYGTVSVDGLPAQDGLNVTAAISETNLTWATKTINGTYGWTQRGSSSFYIPCDDPTTSNKDGGVNDDVIEFWINGVKTEQTTIFESMSLKRTDLAVGSTTGNDKNNRPSFNLYLLYTALAAAIVIGSGIVLWVRRKSHSSRQHNAKTSSAETNTWVFKSPRPRYYPNIYEAVIDFFGLATEHFNSRARKNRGFLHKYRVKRKM